jgi:pimeloyl-ACP methyl ester carboxylesterase
MFVLLHGGGHSARCWEPVIPLLDAPALALDLPGRGTRPGPLHELHLADWIASAVDDIAGADVRDAVLVGHSMAGLSIPGIVDQVHDRLRHIVFVSCAVPGDGRPLLDLLPPDVQAIVESSEPVAEGVSLTPEGVRGMQCYDMDEAQTAFTLDVVVPEAYWPVRDPVSLAGLSRPVPRTWVQLLGDRTFPPALQEEMAQRAGCTRLLPIDSGHMAMISHPGELADALNAIHGEG